MRQFIIAVTFLFITANLYSQSDKVNAYLKMIANGKIEEVKDRLLDLMAEYPDDPGVQLLHGVVIDDAFRAIEIYKRIIKEHPQSEWADDAYWRIIQFYAILGDTEEARLYLEKFHQQCSTSDLLAPATDVVSSAIHLSKSGVKTSGNIKTIEKPLTMEENPKLKEVIANKAEEKKVEIQKPVEVKGSGFYGLQVAIYHDRESATNEMNRFLRQRMRTEVLEKVVGNEKLYAVVIGNYSSKESAEAAKQIVEQQCACKPIIFEK